MSTFFKVLISGIAVLVAMLFSVVLVDNVLLPLLPPELQLRWFYVIGSALIIVSLLDNFAGFTGYSLRDLFDHNRKKGGIQMKGVKAGRDINATDKTGQGIEFEDVAAKQDINVDES